MLRDYLKLHFIVLLWGFTAILGKLLTVPPVELVFWRTLLAATGLAVLLLARQLPWRIPAGQALRLLAVGALVAAHWITFFLDRAKDSQHSGYDQSRMLGRRARQARRS